MSHTILIVEDENSLQKALTDKFNSEGFSVLQAHNGKEGLEIALDQKPDLILLDIVMPEMDGITVIHRLHEDSWGKKVPIILLTNLNDERRTMQAVSEGVFDYLVKSDWSIDEVVGKVKEKLAIG